MSVVRVLLLLVSLACCSAGRFAPTGTGNLNDAVQEEDEEEDEEDEEDEDDEDDEEEPEHAVARALSSDTLILCI